MLGKQERPIETVDKRLLDTIGIQLVKPFWVVTEDQRRQASIFAEFTVIIKAVIQRYAPT
jgi:hypothetical protein